MNTYDFILGIYVGILIMLIGWGCIEYYFRKHK